MALACGPDLLIADEPTTALDVTIQQQILELIRELVAERGMALILISHDLGVMAQNVSRMLVMYGGSVVESGATADVFANPSHPYTLGLFGARPRLGGARGAPARHHSRHGARTGRPAGRLPLCRPLRLVAPRVPRHGAAPCEVGPGQHARCIRLDAVAADQAAAAMRSTESVA